MGMRYAGASISRRVRRCRAVSGPVTCRRDRRVRGRAQACGGRGKGAGEIPSEGPIRAGVRITTSSGGWPPAPCVGRGSRVSSAGGPAARRGSTRRIDLNLLADPAGARFSGRCSQNMTVSGRPATMSTALAKLQRLLTITAGQGGTGDGPHTPSQVTGRPSGQRSFWTGPGCTENSIGAAWTAPAWCRRLRGHSDAASFAPATFVRWPPGCAGERSQVCRHVRPGARGWSICWSDARRAGRRGDRSAAISPGRAGAPSSAGLDPMWARA